MKKKIFLLSLLTTILAILTTGCGNQNLSAKTTKVTATPTLFFHGGGSSYHAEEQMVQAAEKAGVTHSVIRANVDKKGKVSLIGTWSKNAKNPIVEVNYENNRNMNFKVYGQYATNVVKTLQKTYGIKKMNMVGHSAGNISIIYYMLQNGQNKKMPQLQKQVDIAGHFAGLDFARAPKSIRQPANLKLNSAGKPNKMNASYKEMTKVRKIYPKNQVAVLNIIGDIGGKTDGTVPNVSSLSLKYLVATRAKSYKVVKFTGKNAQHSKLHENKQVDKVLIKFLWNK
ncbi:alpha/beta hydrolase [Lactobacillus sp. PV037]|uniref:alpha/beta hydrolase n=1 Tax=unclassified Lactobacillus TaxID=2620435 RepID=UPI00224073FD|nr:MULTISPECIES: alpha/beta hydrolase [unclassified Lactobacillus]QNQ81641.1 alpha/beta hydrolase [Lactobacillus sp. PV012]QNQ84312.1 alpha/beta hydrolase [Lactobacillus sp. PV037]